MTIQIIRVTITTDPDTGEPTGRAAQFIINSGGGAWYLWGVAGLPLTGGVQAMLEADEAAHYAQALASGQLASDYDISLAEGRSWYVSNPGAKTDVFDTTVATLHTNITNLVNASFPAASAAVKTGWVRAIMAGLLTTRAYTFEKDLV